VSGEGLAHEVVVVGGGQGGFQVAVSLREAGYAAPITILGEEPGLPYQRPPLSKAYLTGKADAGSLAFRPAAFFAEHRIAVRAGLRATAIERDGRRVRLADGEWLAYDHLVLATGARNRPLPVPGADAPGVVQLRDLADAETLKTALDRVERIVVVGAGFIGLEVAAVCAARGLAVTVLEAADRVMARAVAPLTSAHFAAAAEAAGIVLVTGAVAARVVTAEGRAAGIETADGRRFPADLVLVGIGVIPNDGLAAESGLAVADGIVVDAQLATADPRVSAIGDCARHPSRFAAGAPVRIESVQNAVDQAKCLAARLAGRPAPYAAVPWFWSDQGPLKLQIAGLAQGADSEVARRVPGSDGLSVFRYRDGRLVAVESANRPADHMIARRLIAAGVSPTPEDAADANFDLKGFMTRVA
jgi:3-phenylpropionate/trans-cinnamate dioxygenase ferredoxin reductase component